ncbi:MAG: PEGA domain-containing protein [Planctomycetota bacterium]|nr:MAG: PEGA domain-containing protein [Planctomycetota bacterium]
MAVYTSLIRGFIMSRFQIAAVVFLLLFTVPAFAWEGKLFVKCDVDGKVKVNGFVVGKTNELITNLPLGKIKFSVVAEGYDEQEMEITLKADETAKASVFMRDYTGGAKLPEKPPKKPKEEIKEEPGEEESKKEDEEKEKPKKFDIKETRKASKEDDNDLLRDIHSSDSDYLVRIVSAAALLRLESKASVDFLDGEFSEKFKSAPDKWFDDSPLFGQSRMLAGSVDIADAFDEKEVKFDTFEETVPGYAAVLIMKGKQEEYRKECRKLQKKMVRLKRKKATGWWGQYSQCDHDIKRMSKDIKDYKAFISRILSILKKRLRSIEDKDLAALAKYFYDHAKGKLKD